MRVILDCDPGNGIPGSDVDDGLALSFLARHPDVELVGVTIVSGNTDARTGYAVAKDYVERFSPGLPVVLGASLALVEPAAPWDARRARVGQRELVEDLWRDVRAPTIGDLPHGHDAAGFLIESVMAMPGEVSIVAVGPLTNIAHAISRHPEFAETVQRIYVMGGGFYVESNPQELNFAIDPEAADVVMGCGAPISLYPLDVTLQTSLGTRELDTWTGFSAESDWLVETTRPWIEFVGAARGRQGMPLHDPLAAVSMLDAEVCGMEPFRVAVETQGRLTRGRSVRWHPETLALADGLDLPDRPFVDVATSVNEDALLGSLARVFRA